MFSIRNRDTLVDPELDEFENMAAQSRAVWLREHNEDGTHFITVPGNDFVPSGAMLDWPIATAPSGWLICDGSQVDRVTYKTLFDVIGTSFGVGNGTTTFNIPDARGRFILGVAAAGTGATLGGTGGLIDHTHTGGTTGATAPGTDSQGGHSHTVGSHTHDLGNHTHTFSDTSDSAVGATILVADLSGPDTVMAPGHSHDVSGTTSAPSSNTSGAAAPGTDTQGSHSHTVNSHTHSGGTSGTGNPPFLALHKIIKT